MRKFLFLMSLLVVFLYFGFEVVRQNVKNDLAVPVSLPSPTPIQTSIKNVKGVRSSDIKKSIFVPYWGLNGEDIEDKYDSYLYFGVVPSKSGLNKKESGYSNIDKFLKTAPRKSEKKLVFRMLDPDVTFPILKDTAAQKVLIRDTLGVAKENGFSGVVLDLEVSAVPFDSLIKQINEFTRLFYEESREKDMNFSIMFYGDTFYRLRPFDIKVLSANADEFFIMSYDFSKSRGNPGPNFPLRGKEVYGYDMTQLADDFLRYLPIDKTTIVFGLFGYDWKVDDRGNSIGQGEPLTLLQIKSKFLGKCSFKDCVIRRKNDSSETEVRYTDESGDKHIVWFEDMESVELKQAYLKNRGFSNFSFWAYSYF